MQNNIIVKGAREHNLKNIDIEIPRHKLVVITGVSGSGKSSLAFDTLFAEGQRRFFDTLSSYASQFVGAIQRPDVDKIEGLSPVISIEQKTTSRSPRSTVGTVTEIYDYMRLLFMNIGEPHSYISGKSMKKQAPETIIENVLSLPKHSKAYCLAPVVKNRKGHYRELFDKYLSMGYIRARVDGKYVELEKNMQVDRYKNHDIDIVVDRFIISKGSHERIAKSIQTTIQLGHGTITLDITDPQGVNYQRFFSQNLYDAENDLGYDDPTPALFSFNSPKGACPKCQGLGYVHDIDLNLLIPNRELSFNQGGIHYLQNINHSTYNNIIKAILKSYNLTLDTPIKYYPNDLLNILIEGDAHQIFDVEYQVGDEILSYSQKFQGLRTAILRDYKDETSQRKRRHAKMLISYIVCSECDGKRLKKESLSYLIDGKNISDWAHLEIEKLYNHINTIILNERQQIIGEEIIRELKKRLRFLLDIGLNYLSLDRSMDTLSGGESQRIHISSQIGAQLCGVLYILDEPSIGLHSVDNERLIKALMTLRDIGNTVIVVEHDRTTIENADYIIDIGPNAGQHGGYVVASDILHNIPQNSLTKQYLDHKLCIVDTMPKPSKAQKKIILKGAKGNNLKNVTIEIPLSKYICVTGLSGSGKSSLINHTLYPILTQHFYQTKIKNLPYDSISGLEYIDKVIEINQKPIGRTPRSTPATYTSLFTHIRELFAAMPEAKIRGYTGTRFSYNLKSGRCPECEGYGVKKIEMNILADIHLNCELCLGKRYNPETLSVKYQGHTIADVLQMTVDEARELFSAIPNVKRILDTLHYVGLGYIHLGQSSTTLSGGEAQRIKLAAELSRRSSGKTLYIMDEPTTGLHFHDIKQLIQIIYKLVEQKNTVIVIEHNLDMIHCCDHIIDMGPKGGHYGGEIIAKGTPKELCNKPKSLTGKYLKEYFKDLKKKTK